MTYTFYSQIAQESMAYNQGYRMGFNQMPKDAGRLAPWFLEKYAQGYKDGFNDYMQTKTRTVVR